MLLEGDHAIRFGPTKCSAATTPSLPTSLPSPRPIAVSAPFSPS